MGYSKSMAILERLPEPLRSLLAGLPCPTFASTPAVSGPPLAERRIAIVSTAGLHHVDDAPFIGLSGDVRHIRGNARAGELAISHMSANFDRSGMRLDWNVAFPLDRLRELAADGTIGSVADTHYAFMGAADPSMMEAAARDSAVRMRGEGVDGVLLVPV